MKITAQVHLLPTENVNPKNHFLWMGRKTRALYNHHLANFLNCIPQHLYFTTTEEYKDGEWVIYPNVTGDTVIKYKKGSTHETNGKKVVASTNPTLWGRLCGASDGQFIESNGNRVSKFVGNPELIEGSGCANIPIPFLKEYIKKYNNFGSSYNKVCPTCVGKGTIKCEDDGSYWNQKCPTCKGKTLITAQETTPIKEVLLDAYWEPFSGIAQLPPRLKISPSGYVYIHKVKEKMFTQEELKSAFAEGVRIAQDEIRFRKTTLDEEFNWWLDKNYPS